MSNGVISPQKVPTPNTTLDSDWPWQYERTNENKNNNAFGTLV